MANKTGNEPSRLTKKIKARIIIFALYYFVVFGFITPMLNDPGVNHLFNFIKLRHALYGLSLFFYSYFFWKRSSKIFISFFTVSGLFILLIFLQSFFTGFDLLLKSVEERGFIDLNRHLLLSYGLMPFFTPLGIAVLLFQYKGDYYRHILVGLILMNAAWLLSLTRREVFGLFITLFIGFILYAYINRVHIVRIIKSFSLSISFFLFAVVFTGILFPAYMQSGMVLMRSTISVIETGKNITGTRDERLAFFGRKKMVKEFEKSPWLGTGFNNLWRIKKGDRAGYEASDYPFQAALAMAGLAGALFFLPVYLSLIRALRTDIKFFKKNSISYQSLNVIFLLAFIISFIFILMQYMNWLRPVSTAGNASGFYIFLGLYFASRELFYESFIQPCKTPDSCLEMERLSRREDMW